MAGFDVTYPVGGRVDDVGQVDALPYPTFPSLYIPYTVGRSVTISGGQTEATDNFYFDYDTEYINIAVAAEQYNLSDSWSLTVGSALLCDTIYMKGIPETIAAGGDSRVIYPISGGSTVTFTYLNNSQLPNTVLYNFKVLTASGGSGVVVAS